METESAAEFDGLKYIYIYIYIYCIGIPIYMSEFLPSSWDAGPPLAIHNSFIP